MAHDHAAVAAIKFALELDSWDGRDFLEMWNEGSFSEIRETWPHAPEYIYIGADPLHPKTVADMQVASQASLLLEDVRRAVQFYKQVQAAAARGEECTDTGAWKDAQQWLKNSATALSEALEDPDANLAATLQSQLATTKTPCDDMGQR